MSENSSASRIVLFESSDGEVTLDVKTDKETVWLTQEQMSLLFVTTKQNISLHIRNSFSEGELIEESVVKESLTTARDGKKYRTKAYMIAESKPEEKEAMVSLVMNFLT